MFKNYFKIAWRNIKRHKVYTTINILGLALGICACVVIYVLTSYELSYDNFHPGKDHIYRVMGDVTESTGDRLHFGRLPVGVVQNSRSEVSGIDVIAGIIPFNAGISIPEGDKPVKHFDSREKDSHYATTVIAEPQYFNVFKYEWLAGNAATALNAPFEVVLTANKALQYFGNESPDKIIGRQVIYDDSITATVSGIVKDWNENTDLSFTDFISFSTIQSSFLKSNINAGAWGENDMPVWTFAKLSAGTTSAQVNVQMNGLVKEHAGADVKLALWLEPLSDMHFNADVIENPFRTADKPTLYGLMAIALFILILAVINFINLSTAQSIQREKEVGVRKVLGSSRTRLIFQFLTETFVLTLFAVILAVFLVKPVLTAFQSFIPNGVAFNLGEPGTIIFLVVVTLITSVLAGLYPAKVLSAHSPVISLKGSGTQRSGDKWLLRKGLIIFQFSVSLVFIIGSIVIANQLKYTREKDLGFNTDAIINIETRGGDSISKISVLAQKLKQVPGISKVALEWLPPMTDNPRGMKLKFKSTDEKDFRVTQVAGNEDFIPLFNIKLLAGRSLIQSDSVKEFVINETLSRQMGDHEPGESIGKILYWNDKPYPVVGVVADFHTKSLHDPITPLCIINRPDKEGSIAIKLASKGKQTSMIRTALSEIENVWKQIYPSATFNYKFYDESLALLYKKDEQTATMINVSMAITIFISCIGLFGLALFTSQKRAKEISIRKILGASITNIAIMLSRDFAVLIIISLVIASPVALYFMNKWLQSFAYRINISLWIFILAGVAAIFIALITVSFQAIKAAIANPVRSLRTE